jgi:hypothetical protein
LIAGLITYYRTSHLQKYNPWEIFQINSLIIKGAFLKCLLDRTFASGSNLSRNRLVAIDPPCPRENGHPARPRMLSRMIDHADGEIDALVCKLYALAA